MQSEVQSSAFDVSSLKTINPSARHFPAGLHYPLPFSSTPFGCRVEDIPTDIVTWDGWSPRDCLNLDPAPPAGWYSIPHWFALTEWHCFDYLDEPTACLTNGFFERVDKHGKPGLVALMGKACRDEGLEPIEWPAPPKLVAHGRPTVLLFPDPVLRDQRNWR